MYSVIVTISRPIAVFLLECPVCPVFETTCGFGGSNVPIFQVLTHEICSSTRSFGNLHLKIEKHISFLGYVQHASMCTHCTYGCPLVKLLQSIWVRSYSSLILAFEGEWVSKKDEKAKGMSQWTIFWWTNRMCAGFRKRLLNYDFIASLCALYDPCKTLNQLSKRFQKGKVTCACETY